MRKYIRELGSKKVPSGWPEQVHFLAGQVSGPGQAK